MFMHTNHEEM